MNLITSIRHHLQKLIPTKLTRRDTGLREVSLSINFKKNQPITRDEVDYYVTELRKIYRDVSIEQDTREKFSFLELHLPTLNAIVTVFPYCINIRRLNYKIFTRTLYKLFYQLDCINKRKTDTYGYCFDITNYQLNIQQLTNQLSKQILKKEAYKNLSSDYFELKYIMPQAYIDLKNFNAEAEISFEIMQLDILPPYAVPKIIGSTYVEQKNKLKNNYEDAWDSYLKLYKIINTTIKNIVIHDTIS